MSYPVCDSTFPLGGSRGLKTNRLRDWFVFPKFLQVSVQFSTKQDQISHQMKFKGHYISLHVLCDILGVLHCGIFLM